MNQQDFKIAFDCQREEDNSPQHREAVIYMSFAEFLTFVQNLRHL